MKRLQLRQSSAYRNTTPPLPHLPYGGVTKIHVAHSSLFCPFKSYGSLVYFLRIKILQYTLLT
jgi:hypothetical protein